MLFKQDKKRNDRKEKGEVNYGQDSDRNKVSGPGPSNDKMPQYAFP
jgi:hypothetical protein